MASNLSCLGLDVSDQAELLALLNSAMRTATTMGYVEDLEIRTWQDPGGARLVLGLQGDEIVDFLPSFAGVPGVRLADCQRLNDDVASGTVVDEDDEQTTAMAFELEQRRAIDSVAPVSGAASVVAFAQDVTVHEDSEAFRRSAHSLMDPDADPDESPPEHIARLGLNWPTRFATESFISYGIFGDPSAAEAYARLNGVVLAAERRTTSLTGSTFIVSRVRTLGFEVDVVLDRHTHPTLPAPGQVIAGTVFLVASMESIGFAESAPKPSRSGRWRLTRQG